MYEYIKGTLTAVSPAYVVVENQGIGYQIYSANPYRFSSQMNQEMTIYIYQAVREDAITLYGFKDLSEKKLYLKLLNVSGIGPKSAMAILANEDHAGLVQAIENNDANYLTKFPGVGKKTASQIVLDLKGKLGDLDIDWSKQQTSLQLESENQSANIHIQEALEALRALGYTAREVKKVAAPLEKLDKDSTDAYLREALKLIMKK